MPMETVFLCAVIAVAFVFDFINGFHDAANSIATIVTTRVLTPNQAVLWAAFFNFIAFLIFNLMVAKTIGIGLINTSIVSPALIFSALVGAIIWNLFTWYHGLPSSSSHALIGGLAGAAVAKAGFSSLIWLGFFKVMLGILFAPSFGIAVALLFSILLLKILRPRLGIAPLKIYKLSQLVSSAFLSLTHGGNDAQKTMGIIAVLIFSAGWIGKDFYIPFWVVISCHLVIALGTLFGGWRIVHVMGNCITELNPQRGAIAETSAACIIFVATQLGIPVSTTHTVTGAVTGVGLVKGWKGVHVPLLRRIFYSWIFTIPAAAFIAALVMKIGHFFCTSYPLS